MGFIEKKTEREGKGKRWFKQGIGEMNFVACKIIRLSGAIVTEALGRAYLLLAGAREGRQGGRAGVFSGAQRCQTVCYSTERETGTYGGRWGGWSPQDISRKRSQSVS